MRVVLCIVAFSIYICRAETFQVSLCLMLCLMLTEATVSWTMRKTMRHRLQFAGGGSLSPAREAAAAADDDGGDGRRTEEGWFEKGRRGGAGWCSSPGGVSRRKRDRGAERGPYRHSLPSEDFTGFVRSVSGKRRAFSHESGEEKETRLN